MTGFLPKKLKNVQTLGEKLAVHRQNIGLSQDKAARHLNLNVRYIKLFEKNKYQDLPADIYALNILKRYADLLKLNPETVAETFRKEKKLYQKTQQKKVFKKDTWWHKIINALLNPRFLKYLVILILLFIILYYLGWSINKITSPPPLQISSPAENLITSERQIEIIGSTQKEVNVTINNKPILIDKEGNFKVQLDLQNNLNIIKISAKKKYSKEQIVYRQIIVNDQLN